MTHYFTRFITQSLTGIPKSITLSPRIETPLKCHNLIRRFSDTAQLSKPSQPQRVDEIVDELSALTLLEISDLAEVLRQKLEIDEMPMMAVMMPVMGFGPGISGAKEEEKKVKTSFDLKLEGGFDAGAKIKIIKEVRACTDLGLKEAKDLVEKVPTLLEERRDQG
ncbi:hypothetical protein SASPL_145170 [Salvia splendens]|uniref:Large subunit ribosomal protein L7/L12 n=1 Tax=Salvia splendens TaxID=180675 RepID=A0A8X8WH49_SALSN|nr:50S ribosomal protein L7/L12-like [Salvia splendens]KAG6394581.1 hypothetical protein SASPL_145170 [Salvia splendens]